MNKKYCIDANVLIQAWQKYYNPNICPDYWNILNELGRSNLIFIPKLVYDEIVRTEDDLSAWLKTSSIPVRKTSENVAKCLKLIFANNEQHKFLVDNTKGRSLADPWVIAHAMDENAIVVTKEEKVTALNSTKIKIPNVCENMGIETINDFELLKRLQVKFSCTITK